MKKACKCSECANKECIIKFHEEAGYKIVDGYYRELDIPSWFDIAEKMPEITGCKDFIKKEIKL